MTDLITALGWNVSIGSQMRLFATVAVTTVAVLASGSAIAQAGVPIVGVQCAAWALWLTWLGLVFPRNRLRDEATPCSRPYRRAFMREILLGVGVAFGQILRPALNGALASERDLELLPSLLIGLPLLLAGLSIVYLGVSALGVARTLFVYEYIPTDTPVTTTGIFQVLRHPLFLGGTMVSLGFAFCAGTQVAIELAAVNVCVVPLYVQLEDRRCCATLGHAYADYRAAVGGVIPRRRSAINRSALAHHASGSIGPTSPRKLAMTR